MKSVKNDSCLKAAFSLYLMTASASECKLKWRKIPCGFQNVHMSICAVLSKIFFVSESIVHISKSSLDPQKGRIARKPSSNFPVVHVRKSSENNTTMVTTGALGMRELLQF